MMDVLQKDFYVKLGFSQIGGTVIPSPFGDSPYFLLARGVPE
jgi:hypothetical protein